MKILHVVPCQEDCGGGPSQSVPMTARAQLRAGLDVAIAFNDIGRLSQKTAEVEREGVKLVRFAFGAKRGTFLSRLGFSWDFFRRFESVAKDYDVIHTHVQWLFPIWWAAHIARKTGKKLVLMPRGSFDAERLKTSKWKKRILGVIDRHYARKADAVWATAESEAKDIRAYVPGTRVEVFPIGLDVGEYGRGDERFEGDFLRLLFLSRISPIKGLDLLAEAWGRVQHDSASCGGWKLLVVGPDDRGYQTEIEKVFAEKCPAGSYEFRGPVYGEEKRRLLADADAFVLPTRNENWGIAVAEAMASGLPVICTKGAPWRCLEGLPAEQGAGDGTRGPSNGSRAGWWCDISVEGIERSLRELVALSDDERRKMGSNGRQWVAEHLDWNRIGGAMRASYERMSRT